MIYQLFKTWLTTFLKKTWLDRKKTLPSKMTNFRGFLIDLGYFLLLAKAGSNQKLLKCPQLTCTCWKSIIETLENIFLLESLISRLFLVFLLLTLNNQMLAGPILNCCEMICWVRIVQLTRSKNIFSEGVLRGTAKLKLKIFKTVLQK